MAVGEETEFVLCGFGDSSEGCDFTEKYGKSVMLYKSYKKIELQFAFSNLFQSIRRGRINSIMVNR